MNIRLLLNSGLFIIILLAASSCLKVDDPKTSTRTEAEEQELLDAYLNSLETMGHAVYNTELGVYYITIEEGEGAYPKDGDTLSIGFQGYLIDQALFSSSESLDANGNQELVLGEEVEDKPIIGWEDGLKQVREGGKIQFIVPSSLAYGSDGQGKIGPYQTLVFVVKLFDLRQATEQ